MDKLEKYKRFVAVGWTLTGADSKEPNASTNAERIQAMKMLHDSGFKTWASIEPIIDFYNSISMIRQTLGFCDLYKVGMMSGSKDKKLAIDVYSQLCRMFTYQNFEFDRPKVYIKDSIYVLMGYERSNLSNESEPMNFAGRDYNIFKP